MRDLPLADPGTPDARSPDRYLWWMARGQWRLLAVNVVVCTTWMLSQALIPTVLGLTVEQGIVRGDTDALARWSLVILALAGLGAVFGTLWHRSSVNNWMHATFRTIQVVGAHVLRTGPAMTRSTPTGEVVSVVASDAMRIANLFESIGQIAAAIVSYGVVAAILLSRDSTLGLIVLLGVPLVTMFLSTVLRPLQRRQNAAREAAGHLTTLGSDTVAGLRVLRGIGGEETFLRRYDEQSAEVLRRGCEVAPVHATLDAARVLLPGIFVVIVTWQGASLVRAGSLNAGDLITFYGTAAYLALPLGFATQFVSHFIRARIGAAKVIRLLAVRSDLETSTDPADPLPPATPPVAPAILRDPLSGVEVAPGQMSAIVTDSPEHCHLIADRLGRFGPERTPVIWGGAPLADLPIKAVRSRIVLGDGDATLFSGQLREGLSPAQGASEHTLREAIVVASAEDVVTALSHGLDTDVEERGRNFSGGQRQRLALTRALLTQAEVLILIDPTSAVDAHTEARIGARLAQSRHSMCTVVLSASPLLLDHADSVQFVEAGQVVAIGTHRDLLEANPRYADVVLRGAGSVVTS